MSPSLSIIVPIYQAAGFLEKCIQSIISQTLADIEIILVDDGSTDTSRDICEKYALQDQRIRVIHQENLGLSAARNTGIKAANGEYIGFVDADDFIRPDMSSKLMDAARRTNADIVVFGFTHTRIDGKMIRKMTPIPGIFSGKEAVYGLLTGSGIDSLAWNKIYRKDLFADIAYPDGRYHEDLEATWKLLARAESVAVIEDPLYIWVQRPDSITGSIMLAKERDHLQMTDEMIEGIRAAYPDFSEECRQLQISKYITIWNRIASLEKNTERDVMLDSIKKMLKNERYPIYGSRQPLRMRLNYFVIVNFPLFGELLSKTFYRQRTSRFSKK